MLNSLQQIGAKISHFFGEPQKDVPGYSKKNIKNLRQVFEGNTIADLLPYQAFSEETGIFFGKNSSGFVIETAPLVGSDPSIEREISSFFEDFLEENDSIQCLLWADHRISPFLNEWQNARRKASPILKEMTNKRADYFKTNQQISSRMFRFILSYSSPSMSFDEDQLRKLSEKKERMLKTLSSFTYAFAWTPKQLLESVSGLVNFSFSSEVKKITWNPFESLAFQFRNGGALKWDKEGLEWDNEEKISYKNFRVTNSPDYWSFGHMQHLIGDLLRDSYRINTPFYLHYGVHCPKQSKLENSFWQRSQFVEKQGRSLSLLRMIPQLGLELKECEKVRQEMTQGSKFVWTQLSAGIWAHPSKMNQSEQSIKSLFRIHQFGLTENKFLHLPQFLSHLPMTWSEYIHDLKNLGGLLKMTLNSECVHFVPMQAEWKGTIHSPGMLLVGRRGQVINWNPFDNRGGNYNILVVGKSGSGKSVFMQDLLISGLSTGAKVFILEVGRSFEKMCDLVEGQQIQFSKSSSICLNPFTFISEQDEDARNDSFNFLKSVISCMVDPKEGTTRHQDGLIEMGIREAWRTRKNQATITDIVKWLNSQNDNAAKILGVMLMSYTKEGVYAKYFEGENNINFTNPMVLIELEELKEKKDLQAVVLQLCIMTITNQAFLGDRKTPFFICIDEAWDLLRAKQSGAFIETLARRLRKYYGSLVIGTQGFDDFFASAGAQAAYDNSDWMCLLKQKETSIAKLNFPDYKKKMLESLSSPHENYREVMICDSEGSFPIARIALDPFSKLLYSTKPEEYSRLKELQKNGLSIVEAIQKLLDENAKK